ncbi:hypothetical protein PHPALM_27828 [Phytophthora palmivora]|uniref:Integrase zinc-binding domain-containing protein n=1 Tax=Phytophthora palmivora TaxID=4796 RepID=A0A2P4XBM5_9STRA|nr:hypothetical protein PHPALM_27828 [Phytophthora palmivora]
MKAPEEAGMTTGVFDADDVFDLDLKVIQTATKDLFSKLKILVGEIPQITDPVPSPPASTTDHQTSSSHYASAAEDESDLSSEPKRMSLGPSGTSMLETRSKIQRRNQPRSGRSRTIPASEDQITAATTSDVSSGTLQNMLHYAHEDFQGGHQGITRTHERLRSEFYWPGMYADVERFVKECVGCASGKGSPPNAGPSPGNIEPTRPFEAVSMDFVTHLP